MARLPRETPGNRPCRPTQPQKHTRPTGRHRADKTHGFQTIAFRGPTASRMLLMDPLGQGCRPKLLLTDQLGHGCRPITFLTDPLGHGTLPKLFITDPLGHGCRPKLLLKDPLGDHVTIGPPNESGTMWHCANAAPNFEPTTRYQRGVGGNGASSYDEDPPRVMIPILVKIPIEYGGNIWNFERGISAGKNAAVPNGSWGWSWCTGAGRLPPCATIPKPVLYALLLLRSSPPRRRRRAAAASETRPPGLTLGEPASFSPSSS